MPKKETAEAKRPTAYIDLVSARRLQIAPTTKGVAGLHRWLAQAVADETRWLAQHLDADDWRYLGCALSRVMSYHQDGGEDLAHVVYCEITDRPRLDTSGALCYGGDALERIGWLANILQPLSEIRAFALLAAVRYYQSLSSGEAAADGWWRMDVRDEVRPAPRRKGRKVP